MKVKDILDSKGRKIFTIMAETSVDQVISELATNKIGFLVVMEPSGALAGVISERDVVHRCMSVKKIPNSMTASEIMTPKTKLYTASEDDEIEQIMTTMTEKKIRHLPIVQNDMVVGVISIGDVIKYILEEKNDAIRSLTDYVSR
ncbi:MAG: CBS domain-containing protein [Bacteriovoracaceae bacterium]